MQDLSVLAVAKEGPSTSYSTSILRLCGQAPQSFTAVVPLIFAVQELVALAGAKEDALQAIQEMEDAKLRLAEQKMARLARVEGALQAQLRAAGGALDEHAGECCSYPCAASDAVLCRTRHIPCRPGCELHVVS